MPALFPGIPGLFQTVARSYFRRGFSISSVQDVLRKELGRGLRRQTLANFRRYTLGIEKVRSPLRFTPRKYRADPENYNQANWNLQRKFSYTVDIRFKNKLTRGDSVMSTRIISDEELTVEELEQQAQLVVDQALDKSPNKVTSVTMTEAFYRDERPVR